jgi:hypothetical protein
MSHARARPRLCSRPVIAPSTSPRRTYARAPASLEQGLGDGPAVDVDEGPGGAGARPVEDPGEEPLAGTRLAQDEDRRQSPRSLRLAVEQALDLLSDGGGRGSPRGARRGESSDTSEPLRPLSKTAEFAGVRRS